MTNSVDEQVERLEAARAAVSPVLKLLGIERVVNIDDQNTLEADAGGYDAAEIVARIQSGSLPLERLVQDSVLRGIFLDTDGEIVDSEMAIDIVRERLPTDAESRLAEMAVLAAVEDDTPGVLDREDVNDVSSRPALETIWADHDYRAMTLADWRSSANSMLSDGKPTLVLIDRDFSREGGATDAGEQLIAELLMRPGTEHLWCCLLTHFVTDEDGEEMLEKEIVARHDLPVNSLVVLSKHQLDADPARFAIRMLGVLFREHLAALRAVMTDAIEAGRTAASDLLRQVTDFQLLSMFAAAINEGVHEPDHIMRPLQAVIRRAMSMAARPNNGTEEIFGPMHQALTVNVRSHGIKADDTSSIQILEMFDPSCFLAGSVQPIEPGDIFQIVDPEEVVAGEKPISKYHLILLAQPCDVMVRSNGHRGKNVPPHWALARVKSYDQLEANSAENVELPTFLDGKPRLIKLAEIVHVPVLALDMCALDPGGYSRLTVGEPVSDRASWSWTRHHEVLSSRVEKIVREAKDAHLRQLRPASSELLVKALTGCLDPPEGAPPNQTVSASISVRDHRLAFGLKRVGRLNDAATRSLLVQATHHQGRPADEAVLVTIPALAAPAAG